MYEFSAGISPLPFTFFLTGQLIIIRPYKTRRILDVYLNNTNLRFELTNLYQTLLT